MKIAGGKDSIIPKGIIEQMTIEIIDEHALFHFNDCKITKAFVEGQVKDGIESKYNERLKKTLCKYPGLNQDEIIKHIVGRLKILSAKK